MSVKVLVVEVVLNTKQHVAEITVSNKFAEALDT